MRRPDEQSSISAVFDALRKEGQEPVEDRTITDNPDCVFQLVDERVAADCTNINLEAVMKWSNSTKRLVPDEQYEIKYALEPHYWIRLSIEEKEPKIDQYKQNGKADKMWLITHALENPPLSDCSDSVIAIMTDAVRHLSPDFDEIWFSHTDRPATRIWKAGDPKVDRFPSWDSDNDKYPFEEAIIFKGTITQRGFAKTVQFGKSFERILLAPRDPNHEGDRQGR